ncbi:MAG: PaaI family thioesterase [Chloroflexota bacterium]
MARKTRFVGTKLMRNAPPAGFGIDFLVNDDMEIVADVTFDESKEGDKGILHGGAIATVLDEAMGAVAYENGKPGYTATMTYNYRSHIPLYETVAIRAWIEKIDGKKVFAACTATLTDGTLAVDGTGLFIASEKLKQHLDAKASEHKDE